MYLKDQQQYNYFLYSIVHKGSNLVYNGVGKGGALSIFNLSSCSCTLI